MLTQQHALRLRDALIQRGEGVDRIRARCVGQAGQGQKVQSGGTATAVGR